MILRLLRFENAVENGEEVVLMTTKGEAIALGIAEITTAVIDNKKNDSSIEDIVHQLK